MVSADLLSDTIHYFQFQSIYENTVCALSLSDFFREVGLYMVFVWSAGSNIRTRILDHMVGVHLTFRAVNSFSKVIVLFHILRNSV